MDNAIDVAGGIDLKMLLTQKISHNSEHQIFSVKFCLKYAFCLTIESFLCIFPQLVY